MSGSGRTVGERPHERRGGLARGGLARAGGRRGRSETEFDEWLESATERADPFMAWLGVVFGLLVGYELAVEVSQPAATALALIGWSIWTLFAVEFAAKLWLAPNRCRFLRRHGLQVAMLLIPTLRVLRFLRLVRLGRALPAARIVSSSYRSVGTARRLFRSRIGYLAGVSVVAAIAFAELAFLFERSADNGIFGSFGDAVTWSFSAVLALQAEPVPATIGGRITMLLAFAFGVVIVASLAGTIGAFLVDERRERAQGEEDG